ncbi:ABC transporter ATP-binding protein [Paenibacillus marchantiophytorum]|uniref:ABC transporter ATP-binding protein n=1 Tax=Paenibacillus marchantiophytorum TaxID=1619310 RepID=A0ABQ2BQ13_9BACL|nr:ABC transporter ATP-binding protein [Paenibacillus marchantiophytorum]GGI44905.1 ABC transporter ATP-binding protein [Paenibacillus marchantiophytorum]
MAIKQREAILQVKNLHVAYKQSSQEVNILNQLSFELREGEILSLLGESGSGKSTIAKALTGLLPASAHIQSGMLHIGTQVVAELASTTVNWKAIRGRQIAMLFQDARQALNPVLKIRDHFKETLLFHRAAASDQVIPITIQLLRKLHFEDELRILDCYPFQLSGGMCQRICLALALCLKPLVLIADEPTSSLDIVSQKEVLDLLKSMQEEFGLSVLLITHDIAVANAVSDRVLVLHKGVIEEEGDARSVFTNPQTAYMRHLLNSRYHIASPSQVLGMRDEHELILEISQLEKRYDQKPVLHDVNLQLHKGDIVGILGESGCGKSTLARCLTGLEPLSRGSILYRGREISRLKGKEKREMCQHIQMVFQDARASLNPGRTAWQLVQEPLRYLHIGQKKEWKTMAKLVLEEVGICGDARNRRPPQLSSGQCQRVAIARALVLGPDILICDEAVSSLDMSVRAQILELLQRMQQQLGFSIIMISHDIRVLESFCHHIAVMNQGKFCETRPADQLRASTHAYTQLLLNCAGDLEDGFYAKGGNRTYDLQYS